MRRIEWEEAPPNFLVVFPLGALESAPQFHVLVSSVDTPESSAAMPNCVTAGSLVDRATKCFATASSFFSFCKHHSRAVRALASVSCVVNVFDAIGMQHTVADYTDSIIPHRVRPYHRASDGRVVNAPYECFRLAVEAVGHPDTAAVEAHVLVDDRQPESGAVARGAATGDASAATEATIALDTSVGSSTTSGGSSAGSPSLSGATSGVASISISLCSSWCIGVSLPDV